MLPRWLVWSVATGAALGLLYTLSPLLVWVAAAACAVPMAGRGLAASDRRLLNGVLAIALAARLLAVGGLFLASTPYHDDQSAGFFSGDETYNLNRALRTRDVLLGSASSKYDYVVAYDEYGRNGYVSLLTAAQVIFGPTPYAMRLLNGLIYVAGAVLLFRQVLPLFGPLPAFFGLLVVLFLPTLFVWSISLLKESLYFLASAVAIVAALRVRSARSWRAGAAWCGAGAAALFTVSRVRPDGLTLALLGLTIGWLVSAVAGWNRRLWFAASVVAVVIAGGALRSASASHLAMSAIERLAKTQTGHVFTVGHAYKLLDEGFYMNPHTPAASSLTLTVPEAARFVLRAVVSLVITPVPWQLKSIRELTYLPEQLIWYVVVALLPIGIIAGWRIEPTATALLAAYAAPTAFALALTNGNVGTLLRLRATMVIPYVVWVSAIGGAALLQWLVAGSDRRRLSQPGVVRGGES